MNGYIQARRGNAPCWLHILLFIRFIIFVSEINILDEGNVKTFQFILLIENGDFPEIAVSSMRMYFNMLIPIQRLQLMLESPLAV